MADISNPSNKPITGSVIIDGTSYSGADIKVVVHIYDKDNATEEKIKDLQTAIRQLPTDFDKTNLQQQIEDLKNAGTGTTKVLAELQTLSVSTYREKYPVRALSTVYPKGFTRGPRTIAGSMVFSVFDKNVLYELLQADSNDFDAYRTVTSALIDQLPPFDISILFANESGQTSRMSIYGVEFVSEGQTMSIQDLFIENTVQYVARDIDPMTREGVAKRDKNMNITGTEMFTTTSASDLLNEKEAKDLKKLNDPFERFRLRNDPFT